MLTNPILSNFKSFRLYLLFWLIIIAIYLSILTFGIKADLYFIIIDSLVFNIILSGLGLSFWYSARFIPLENNNFSKIIFSHIFGGVLLTITWLYLGYNVINIFIENFDDYSKFFFETLSWRFLIGLLIYFLITSFYYIITYYTRFQEKIVTENKYKNLAIEAELKNLKFQINSHFLFNSLNSLSALTTINPKKAKVMIQKLADFLRYTLPNNEKQKNKLGEELRNIKLYLEIEKIRFEDKFEYVEKINEECKQIEVPNMILQPLIENAIKHAVYETLDKVTITLTCTQENEFLKINLTNNYDKETKTNKGSGIGLKNIEGRLELLYGRDNLLKVKKTDNTFSVSMYIPLEEELNYR